MDLRDAALYLGLGWQILPLRPQSKLPATAHGCNDASDDADLIDRWAHQYPHANLGIATGARSGIVVIDIDPRHGGDASVDALGARGLTFLRGPTVRTANGGVHLYLRHVPGLRCSAGRLGRGIDVKADGGYVVAPPSWVAPSEHGPGGPYSWAISPLHTPLPALPNWAIDCLQARAKRRLADEYDAAQERGEASIKGQHGAHVPDGNMRATVSDLGLSRKEIHEARLIRDAAERRLEGMARHVASARQGRRNETLNWAAYTAGLMVRQGELDGQHVESRLREAALAAGLPAQEVHATLRSALGAATQRGSDA